MLFLRTHNLHMAPKKEPMLFFLNFSFILGKFIGIEFYLN